MATSLNPTAQGLLLDATEFLNASELLLNRSAGVSLPTFFLLGRAIELSLKAYLLHTGCKAQKLKRLGHDLTTLYQAANECGLPDYAKLEQLELGALDLLSQEYLSTRLVYRDTGGIYYLPRIDLAESAARRLVAGVDKAVATPRGLQRGTQHG